MEAVRPKAPRRKKTRVQVPRPRAEERAQASGDAQAQGVAHVQVASPPRAAVLAQPLAQHAEEVHAAAEKPMGMPMDATEDVDAEVARVEAKVPVDVAQVENGHAHMDMAMQSAQCVAMHVEPGTAVDIGRITVKRDGVTSAGVMAAGTSARLDVSILAQTWDQVEPGTLTMEGAPSAPPHSDGDSDHEESGADMLGDTAPARDVQQHGGAMGAVEQTTVDSSEIEKREDAPVPVMAPSAPPEHEEQGVEGDALAAPSAPTEADVYHDQDAHAETTPKETEADEQTHTEATAKSSEDDASSSGDSAAVTTEKPQEATNASSEAQADEGSHAEKPSAEIAESKEEVGTTADTTQAPAISVDAHAAVRESFARIHSAEVDPRVLYPSVEKQVSTTITEQTPQEAINEKKLERTKLPTIFIKLEPHSNFEIGLLRATASQKRQEAKMHHIETNKGDLYNRLERYLYSEYLIHSASTALAARKREIDSLVEQVWVLETKCLSSTKRCGDETNVEEHLEFQTAKLDTHQLAKLRSRLEQLRQLRTIEASLHTYDRAMAFFHVEQYLNEVLGEPSLVAFLNKMNAASMVISSRPEGLTDLDTVPASINFYDPLPSESTLASSIDHLKYCIDVLVFFEKQVTLEDRGLFGRIPSTFCRGELLWHSNDKSVVGAEKKVRCYACGQLNAPMDVNQACKFCEGCGVVLYMPPSSVSTNTNEWYCSVTRFRQSLQKWISLCFRTVLRLRLLANMPFVLMHVMYLPRISTDERSWVLRFLQFPKAIVTNEGEVRREWTEELVDHYIAMIHLVFHPEKLRRLSKLVSSETPVTRSKVASASNEPGKVSPEWVLLENPEKLNRRFLSDHDFVALLNQFPNMFALEQLFRCSRDIKKTYNRALTLVSELTQAIRVFQDFEHFPDVVARLLSTLLANATLIPTSTASITQAGDSLIYPTLFDQVFMAALHGMLISNCNRDAWKIIQDFPFGSLSELTKWDVLALLLFGIHHVPNEVKNRTDWKQFITKVPVGSTQTQYHARNVLFKLIEYDPDNALHLLNAVARLAASCPTRGRVSADSDSAADDLVIVATHELFLAGFAHDSCRQALGGGGERAAGPISTICLAHPWILSELISLLFKYHECVSTWIQVFETFPVHRWLPTPTDLVNIQEWLLLSDHSSPRSALARFLLDHINWEYDAKQERLFTSPYLHRQVALVVAEALVAHRVHQQQGDGLALTKVTDSISRPTLRVITRSIRRALRLEDAVDFETWCWRLVLKLKFFSPVTHEPLVDLIELRTDRSREALLLRRWFPNSAMPSSSTNHDIPFFRSHEDQIRLIEEARRRGMSDDQGFRSLLIGGGSAGVPIHEEQNEAIPVANGHGMEDLESTVALLPAWDTEPIAAYLVCQTTTFLFSDRVDRWEPLLVLLKNNQFTASARVLENVLPLKAKLDAAQREPMPTDDKIEGDSSAPPIDHELHTCMAAIENLTTDQMLQLTQVLHANSYLSADEYQLLLDLLNKGYIGGWESLARKKVVPYIRFVRECSRYLHPLVLPAMINEWFPQPGSTSLSTGAIFQGALSWLTSFYGNGEELPSPSEADDITSALALSRSSLVATVPSATSTAVTAAAAAASLGILEAPGEYSATTQEIAAMIRRGFAFSSPSGLHDLAVYWLRTILQIPLWFGHPSLRHLIDVLLRCSSERWHRGTVRNDPSGGDLVFALVGILRDTFDGYCHHVQQMVKDAGIDGGVEVPRVMSFLPVDKAGNALSSIFGGDIDSAQYVGDCPMLSFWQLLVEIRQEVPLFLAMGRLVSKYEPKAMGKVEKMKQTEGKIALELHDVGLEGLTATSAFQYAHTSLEVLSQYKIYRWCEYCLQMAEDDDIQVLYWQVLFAVFFACSGGNHMFGHLFLDHEDAQQPTRVDLRKKLREKLRQLSTYWSNQAQAVLAVGNSAAATESKEKRYHHYVQLSHVFVAMDTWLEEKDPNGWLKEDEFAGLPRHFDVARLKQVLLLSDKLLNTPDPDFQWKNLPLWTDLCGFEFSKSTQPTRPRRNSELEDTEDSLAEEFAMIDEDVDNGRINAIVAEPLVLTPEFSGPVALTVLPHVTITFTEDQCTLTPSIPLNKVALKTVAMKFSENLSMLVSLDAEVLDDVSRLYSSKMRVVTESKPCHEGSNCLQPAAFRFEFTEWAANNQLLDAIHAILAQSERYDMTSMRLIEAECTSEVAYQGESASPTEFVRGEVDGFLQLDPDGQMLSHQILLIDQVVEALDSELNRMKRQLQVANATADPDDEKHASESQELEGRLAKLQDQGLEWFRTLTEMDTKLSRMLPPFREVLWRSIKQLGISFVRADERETAKLLQLMLDDPSRIALLGECFAPASAPTRFVDMFSKLMSASASSKLSIEDKLTILLRFDFRAWLQVKLPHTPTRQDRDTVLNIVLGDVCAQFSLEEPSTANQSRKNATQHAMGEVQRVYASIVHLICVSHLGDHLEAILRALVGVHDDYRFANGFSREKQGDQLDVDESAGDFPRPAVSAIWDAVVTVPTSAWEQVSLEQSEECVSFLSSHIGNLRWQGATVDGDTDRFRASMKKYPLMLWQRAGIIKCFLDLFTMLVRFAPDSQQWSLISAFFEPLLSSLYQPASTTAGSCICAPWSESDAGSIGTALCSCFVAICSEYLKAKPSITTDPASTSRDLGHSDRSQSIQQRLNNIWDFYRDHLIAHAPVHVCKIFHQFLTRLSWEKWCLTLEIVREMQQLVQDEKRQLATESEGNALADACSSPYPFVSWMVRDILCRLTWKATEEWMATQSEAVRSLFLCELGKLCVELVLDHPHYQPRVLRVRVQSRSANVLPPYFVNFIKQQPAFWSRCTINTSDLDALLEFTFNALTEPLRDTSKEESTRLFPTSPSATVLQDAFSRIQLVLRFLSQITTLRHPVMAKAESLNRLKAFVRIIARLFQHVGAGREESGRAEGDHSSWQVVMTGSSCTVLFEKLDELVQVCRPDTRQAGEDEISDEDLVSALVEVLRLLNLPIVERFFQHHSLETPNAITWSKCGNVTFVEVDGLIRDFAATNKVKASVSSDWELADVPSGEELNPVLVAMGATLGRLLWSFMGFRGGELCCLAASGRAIGSVHLMSRVSERSIEKWIIEERRGSWEDLVSRLRVPELSEDEFEASCLQQGNLMTLQVLFLQHLRKAPIMTEALATGMLSKMVAWMERAHAIATTTAMMEMKILFLAAETTNFVCRALDEILPSQHKKQMLRELCNILLRFGNARRQHGIMKAIGIGGSLRYNIEFHVCAMTIGIYLRLQTRNSVALRLDERIPFHITQTTQKQLKSLEQLLTSKNCLALQKRMEWMLEFLRNPARSLADQDEFFVSLFSRIYPTQAWMLVKCGL